MDVKSLQQFKDGVLSNNPVLVQLLGMCPVLAITNSVENALVMGAAATFVVICSNMIISLLRPLIQPHVRILIFTLTKWYHRIQRIPSQHTLRPS